jgi:hypothetical protein
VRERRHKGAFVEALTCDPAVLLDLAVDVDGVREGEVAVRIVESGPGRPCVDSMIELRVLDRDDAEMPADSPELRLADGADADDGCVRVRVQVLLLPA